MGAESFWNFPNSYEVTACKSESEGLQDALEEPTAFPHLSPCTLLSTPAAAEVACRSAWLPTCFPSSLPCNLGHTPPGPRALVPASAKAMTVVSAAPVSSKASGARPRTHVPCVRGWIRSVDPTDQWWKGRFASPEGGCDTPSGNQENLPMMETF